MVAKKTTKKKTTKKGSGRKTPAKKASSAPAETEARWWIRRSAVQEVTAISLLGVAIFLFLALFSNMYGVTGKNLCGPLGHKVAEQLVMATGLFSLAIPTVIVIWSIMILLEKKVTHFGARALAAVVLLLSLATLGTYLPVEGPSGGGIGAYLQNALETRLSTLGSLILLGTIILAATVVATDWLLVSVASRMMNTMRQKATLAAAAASGSAGSVVIDRAPSRRKEKAKPKKQPPAAAEKPKAQEAKAEAPKKKTAKKGGNPILPPQEEEEAAAAAAARSVSEKAKTKASPKSKQKEEAAPKAVASKSTKKEDSPVKAQDEAEGKGVLSGIKNRLKAGKKDASPAKATTTVRINAPARSGFAAVSGTAVEDTSGDYSFPPLDLLNPASDMKVTESKDEIRRKSLILEHTLKNFKIEAEVVEICQGPVITQYELELAAGVKVSRITSFSDDLSMALAAESVRIVAPIPGKSTVGIEIPNTHRELVFLRELFEHPTFRRTNFAIPLMLGKDASGVPIIEDMAQMPHLLIAGATGSGKSVCINSIILSILMTRSPDDVQMILIDPKMVELSMYADIPHLLTPVVTDMKRAPFILEWAVQKMEERYELLAEASVRNIASFNQLPEEVIRERLQVPETGEDGEDTPEVITHLPYIVIVVDELADLMMTASKEVENSITRLSQKSRAVGIHIILATQRPSVDVITGLIKSNMPARISFKVAGKVDSRTILDRNGAEKLLGQGDMLYLPPRTSELKRSQGTWLDDKEIMKVTKHLKKTSAPTFNAELSQVGTSLDTDNSSKDDLYDAAVRLILESQRGSVSLLQRQLGVGYTRAARLVDLMAKDGLVGKYKGSQAREVLVSLEEWEEAQQKRASSKTKKART